MHGWRHVSEARQEAWATIVARSGIRSADKVELRYPNYRAFASCSTPACGSSSGCACAGSTTSAPRPGDLGREPHVPRRPDHGHHGHAAEGTLPRQGRSLCLRAEEVAHERHGSNRNPPESGHVTPCPAPWRSSRRTKRSASFPRARDQTHRSALPARGKTGVARLAATVPHATVIPVALVGTVT